VIAEVWADTGEAGYFAVLVKVIQLIGKRQIGKTVGVVGEEDFLAGNVFLNGFEALADIGIDSGIREGDFPVVSVSVEELDVSYAGFQHKIVGETLVVIQEIVLNEIRAVTQAKNKILVTVVSVIFHDVPHHRTVADGNHRFGNRLGIFPQPHTQTAAEEDHFHRIPP
jgi:hypothetical protein